MGAVASEGVITDKTSKPGSKSVSVSYCLST